MFCHGGYSNVVENCRFGDCQRALGYGKWDQKRWERFLDGTTYPYMRSRLKVEVDVESALYRERYPFLRGFFRPVEMH